MKQLKSGRRKGSVNALGIFLTTAKSGDTFFSQLSPANIRVVANYHKSEIELQEIVFIEDIKSDNPILIKAVKIIKS